jgi:hypothetical protein
MTPATTSGFDSIDRQLDIPVEHQPRLEEVAHPERRVARLQGADRLALVGHESGHVHEPGDLLRRAGDRDHATAVGVAHEHDGPVDLVDDRSEI